MPPQGGVTGHSLVVAASPIPNGIRELPDQWVQAEHPIPDHGSLKAGERILEFLASLPPGPLEIYLSGGASSLAWVPLAGWSLEKLREELQELQLKGLSIAQLNRRRSRLCALKAGGAGHWLRRFSPGVRASVTLVSDVLPYGPEVVGSGPFWSAGILHRVRADNSTLIRGMARHLKSCGIKVKHQEFGQVVAMDTWIRRVLIGAEESGFFLFGCEPKVQVGHQGGQGGRMSHVATRLALDFLPLLQSGEMEILCASSDGRDGESGGSGVYLNFKSTQGVSAASLKMAMRTWSTGSYWKRKGALLPEFASGTNVQDVVALWRK